MIIKEIRIKNFRSYYGENRFEFSDGLTLILGDNGDGKTTFFEALQWLFNTTNDKGSIEQLSEMRKSKMEIGDRDEVSVFMSFDHDGDKLVEKSFSVERVSDDFFRITNFSFKGYEDSGAERIQVSGKYLIDRCYDAFIQRFSMFKGESELNVFDNASALKDLVNKFSDIRKFDDLVDYTSSFEEKSNTAYLKEMKSDKKVANEAKELESKINRLAIDISDKKAEIKEKNASLELYTRKVKELEDNQEVSEKYNDIQNRIKTKKDDRIRKKAQRDQVVFNHALLDKMWILCAFPPILKEFKKKCSALSREKREQNNNFIEQKGREKGELDTLMKVSNKLKNGAIGLPWDLPDDNTLEEMLHDHICKVCGRPAEEGSEAYNFMLKKLEDFRKHIVLKAEKKAKEEAIEAKELFKYEYIEQIHNLCVQLSGSNEAQLAGISREIRDRKDLVARLTFDLKKLDKDIQEMEDEKSRLLIQAGNVPESVLEKNFNDIKGLFDQKERAGKRLADLQGDLKLLEQQMDSLQKQMDALNPDSSQVKVYREVHRVFEEIAKAFSAAKKENLRRFLADLEERANEHLQSLSTSDFHGEVRLRQTADDSTGIRLYSSNGTEIKKPSGSQLTLMYISVLFAISDFTQEKRDEKYPLIFDAATSSFGDSKEESFYNVIDNLKRQCIIVTKDFITKGQVRTADIGKLTCSVYRIRKAAGFDANNLATVRTTIEKLK